MQLVDEGQLDLDAPVVEVLPELRAARSGRHQAGDRAASAHAHQRHRRRRLHRHRPRRRLPREVRRAARGGRAEPSARRDLVLLQLGLLAAGSRDREAHRVDLGRRRCATQLFEPLGLQHTVTLPEEALLFAAAVGHVAEEGADPKRAPVWGLPRSLGPAGLISSTVADVLAFARMHLTGGVAADGTRVLSEAERRGDGGQARRPA